MKKQWSNSSTQAVFKKPSNLQRLWRAFFSHRRAWVAFLVCVLCLGLSVAGWFSYQGWRRHRAQGLFDVARGLDDYEKLARRFSGTPAAALALIHLAELRWKEGRPADAGKVYEEFLTEFSESPFAPFAKNAMGECLLREKRFAEAEAVFLELRSGSGSSFLKHIAQINLGRVFFQKGDIQKGLFHFQALKRELGQGGLGNPWSQEIESFIRFHGGANVQN